MSINESAAYLCFDPRDATQSIADRTTWKLSGNAILISATMLFAADGETCPISWEKVAALADLCDEVAPEPGHPLDRRATLVETNGMLRAALDKCARPAAEA